MTIHADWRWWTYFSVNDKAVSAGHVEQYDIQSKQITYLNEAGNGTNTEKYKAVWVNPQKSIVLKHDEIESLENNEKPESFILLIGEDPQKYFADEQITVSSYVPAKLQRQIDNYRRGEDAG